MPARGSLVAGDLGFGGRTTGHETSVGKNDIPMPGAAAAALAGRANKLVANAPVFWLIAILLFLGVLKVAFEWKAGAGVAVKI